MNRVALQLIGIATAVAAASCASSPISIPAPQSNVPATPVDYRRLEAEVLDAVSLARSNPRSFATSLDAMLGYFDGLVLRRPGTSAGVRTVEGAAAVREAAGVLRVMTPVPTMAGSDGLSRAARDHAEDQARTGQLGHTGSDGSSTSGRVNRYGAWGGRLSESIAYASFRTGREVIENLIVDDGVSDRGHRRNLLDSETRLAGVGCGPHPRYTMVCVIVQAGAFTPKR
jgi:uncharacterized protein YkwD